MNYSLFLLALFSLFYLAPSCLAFDDQNALRRESVGSVASISSVSDLPPELIDNISRNLNIKDRTRMFATSREFNTDPITETQRSTLIAETVRKIEEACRPYSYLKQIRKELFLVNLNNITERGLKRDTFTIQIFRPDELVCYQTALEHFDFFPHIEKINIEQLVPRGDPVNYLPHMNLFVQYLAQVIAKNSNNVKKLILDNTSYDALVDPTQNHLSTSHLLLATLFDALKKNEVDLDELHYVYARPRANSNQQLQQLIENSNVDMMSRYERRFWDSFFGYTLRHRTLRARSRPLSTFGLKLYGAPTFNDTQYALFQRFLVNSGLSSFELNVMYGGGAFSGIRDSIKNFFQRAVIQPLLGIDNTTTPESFRISQIPKTITLSSIAIHYASYGNIFGHFNDYLFKLFCIPTIDSISIQVDSTRMIDAREFTHCLMKRQTSMSAKPFRKLEIGYNDETVKGFGTVERMSLLPFNLTSEFISSVETMTMALLNAASGVRGAKWRQLESLRFPLLLSSDLRQQQHLNQLLVNVGNSLKELHVNMLNPMQMGRFSLVPVFDDYRVNEAFGNFLGELKTVGRAMDTHKVMSAASWRRAKARITETTKKGGSNAIVPSTASAQSLSVDLFGNLRNLQLSGFPFTLETAKMFAEFAGESVIAQNLHQIGLIYPTIPVSLISYDAMYTRNYEVSMSTKKIIESISNVFIRGIGMMGNVKEVDFVDKGKDRASPSFSFLFSSSAKLLMSLWQKRDWDRFLTWHSYERFQQSMESPVYYG